MPWIEPEKKSHYNDEAHVRWYKRHHWQPRRVRALCNKRDIYVWFPPDERYAAPDMDSEPKKRPRRRLLATASETPFTWLTMLTAWYHLRERGAPMESTEKFTLDHFLDRFFADWERAASIMGAMARTDQSAIMQHFEIEKLHAGTRSRIQRARADYLASQAAREPDPLAED